MEKARKSSEQEAGAAKKCNGWLTVTKIEGKEYIYMANNSVCARR